MNSGILKISQPINTQQWQLTPGLFAFIEKYGIQYKFLWSNELAE